MSAAPATGLFAFLQRQGVRMPSLAELRKPSAALRLLSYELLGALVGFVAVVALLAVHDVPKYLCPLGALLGLFYYYPASRRERRRQRILAQPVPPAHVEILRRRVPYYAVLTPDERRRFESEVEVFLAEQRIYEFPDTPGPPVPASATSDAPILVAASAATLLLGRPEWRLPTVRDIVLYPGAFTEKTYQPGPLAHTVGMVHAQGPILLSLPALYHCYPEHLPAEPITENVGIHEFAHVLDFAFSDGQAGGVPGNLPGPTQRQFYRQLQIERTRLQQSAHGAHGHQLAPGEPETSHGHGHHHENSHAHGEAPSILHPYGLKSDAELFAVSVEMFFTDPLRLRSHHSELYQLLSSFFNQDPASRHLPAPALLAPWLWPWQSQKARYVA